MHLIIVVAIPEKSPPCQANTINGTFNLVLDKKAGKMEGSIPSNACRVIDVESASCLICCSDPFTVKWAISFSISVDTYFLFYYI